MARGVPILSDIVFKYIFGTEGSTEILKTFINAVVNPFNDKTYMDEKYSIIDTRNTFPATAAICSGKTTAPIMY